MGLLDTRWIGDKAWGLTFLEVLPVAKLIFKAKPLGDIITFPEPSKKVNFPFLSHPILEILWFQKIRRLYFPLLQTTTQNQPSSRGQWYFFAMACSSRPSWDPKRLVKLPMPNFTAFGVRFLIFCGEKREVGLINVGYKYLDSNYEFSSPKPESTVGVFSSHLKNMLVKLDFPG